MCVIKLWKTEQNESYCMSMWEKLEKYKHYIAGIKCVYHNKQIVRSLLLVNQINLWKPGRDPQTILTE